MAQFKFTHKTTGESFYSEGSNSADAFSRHNGAKGLNPGPSPKLYAVEEIAQRPAAAVAKSA